jgi:two-component system, OmpR family, sensor kinase
VEEIWHASTLLASRRFRLGPVAPGTLLADPDRLAQALRNLLANAIEHTTPGRGLVLMRVEHAAGNERIRFVVEDDGPGIPAEERERVFDRFHRTDAARDRASGGTGLGLAIVDAIAKAHGGSCTVQNTGHGSVFALRIPAVDAGGAAADADPGPSSPALTPPVSANGPRSAPASSDLLLERVDIDLAGAEGAGRDQRRRRHDTTPHP